ncbi:MAG: FeoB-associated Cys-rich membrane protein [Clostridia bacterium]|nr:FeoB-associated Cys-rich membrane protein [Clostridia bacterium]
MLDWFMNNWGTLIILAVLIVAVVFAVVVIKRDKKKGKSSCGGSCQSCAMGCHCSKNEAE